MPEDGMSKAEVEKHLKDLETNKGKIGYLNRILGIDERKNFHLLAKKTRKNVYKTLGQLFEKDQNWNSARLHYGAAFDRKNAKRMDYLEHAEIAEKKGDYKRAKRLRRLIKKEGLEREIPVVIGLGIILGTGLYYLFSDVSITGSVVTNIATNSFLPNFVLLGILGLVCYSYMK